MDLIIGDNSYMTLEEAETLMSSLFDDDNDYISWSALSEDNKTKLIINGTQVIDNLPFLGIKYGNNKLKWPRIISGNIVECPDSVKLGLILQAIRTKEDKNKQETQLKNLGVKSYSIKNASITFGEESKTELNNGIHSDIYHNYFAKWTY